MALPPQAPGAVSQGAMGSEGVVLFPPSLDNHLGLPNSIENLLVEHIISHFSVEGFVVSILPGAARLDEQCLDPNPPKPVPDRLGGKFRPIV